MADFKDIVRHCQELKEIEGSLIDDFLIYYAAAQKNLHNRMMKLFKNYRHVTREFDPAWENMLRSQYIAQRIFKNDGMIHTLLNHSALKDLPGSEYHYLELLSRHPWRFCFSRVIDTPEKDFYQMEDIFTKDEFLIYSKATSGILNELDGRIPLLWFNLIGFNGKCWQTYGPIAYFMGFTPEDIFFFSMENNADVYSEKDVVEDIQNDPLPYMMLLSGWNIPVTYHKKEELAYILSEYDIESLHPSYLKKDFTIEFSNDIYRITSKKWGGFPHFSRLYYDEKEHFIELHAMTDRGFRELSRQLSKFGIITDNIPQIRVHPSMITIAGKILKKEIDLDLYQSFFPKDHSEEDQTQLDDINNMLAELIPSINEGTAPDFEYLSAKYNQKPEDIRELYHDLVRKIGRAGH